MFDRKASTLWECLTLWWYGVIMEYRFNKMQSIGQTIMWQKIKNQKPISDETYIQHRLKFSDSVDRYWLHLEFLKGKRT